MNSNPNEGEKLILLNSILPPVKGNDSSDDLCNEEEESKLDENNDEYRTGRWHPTEHSRFIKGCLLFGNNWKKVKECVKTRSSAQIRSHAQKYIIKLNKKYGINDQRRQLKSIKSVKKSIRPELINGLLNNFNFSDLKNENFDMQALDMEAVEEIILGIFKAPPLQGIKPTAEKDDQEDISPHWENEEIAPMKPDDKKDKVFVTVKQPKKKKRGHLHLKSDYNSGIGMDMNSQIGTHFMNPYGLNDPSVNNGEGMNHNLLLGQLEEFMNMGGKRQFSNNPQASQNIEEFIISCLKSTDPNDLNSLLQVLSESSMAQPVQNIENYQAIFGNNNSNYDAASHSNILNLFGNNVSLGIDNIQKGSGNFIQGIEASKKGNSSESNIIRIPNPNERKLNINDPVDFGKLQELKKISEILQILNGNSTVKEPDVLSNMNINQNTSMNPNNQCSMDLMKMMTMGQMMKKQEETKENSSVTNNMQFTNINNISHINNFHQNLQSQALPPQKANSDTPINDDLFLSLINSGQLNTSNSLGNFNLLLNPQNDKTHPDNESEKQNKATEMNMNNPNFQKNLPQMNLLNDPLFGNWLSQILVPPNQNQMQQHSSLNGKSILDNLLFPNMGSYATEYIDIENNIGEMNNARKGEQK